jgi:hypothetical protein
VGATHPPRHRVLWHPGGDDSARPGDAHGERPGERLLRITVDEVVGAVLDLPPREPSRDTPADARAVTAAEGSR